MAEQIGEKIQIHTNIDAALRSQNPFIYKKTNVNGFEAIPFNNLFGVIADIGDNSLNRSDIPQELISNVDLSMEAPKATYNNDKDSVAYYSPHQGDTKENVLNIIQLFNNLSSKNITIYTSNDIHKYISAFANENITFCSYNTPEEISINANMVITYGYSARSFIKQKIPTLILGPNGLGGWVTPDNISYFLKDNFKGRPGGRFNEYAPLQILVDEILEMNEEKNMTKILNKNALILTDYSKGGASESIDSVINSITGIYKKLNHKDDRYFLRPKLPSNVSLFSNEDKAIIIKRKTINDVLFSIPESEEEFLEDLKENLTFKELRDKYEMDENDFWDIIIPLWERKAITLSI